MFTAALCKGMGNTLIPMVSGIAEFALRVAVVWTLPAIFGPNSIFFAEIAAWAGAAAILLSAYYVCVRALPHAGRAARLAAAGECAQHRAA